MKKKILNYISPKLSYHILRSIAFILHLNTDEQKPFILIAKSKNYAQKCRPFVYIMSLSLTN